MPNRDCNLECVKGKAHEEDEVVEFVGPVKIILVDQQKHSYKSKIYNAAFIVLAQMTMAATFFVIIFFSLSYKKRNFMKALHVFLCTIGLQLLLPTGVLSMNSLNGAAAPMTISDRKFEHGMVQIFGLGITIAGSVVSYFADYPKFLTIHSFSGIVANVLGILSGIVGLFIYIFCNMMFKDHSGKLKRKFLLIHYILGVLTITISSICVIRGMFGDSFIRWLPIDEMWHCLCIFCIFCTTVVTYKPLCLINEYH